MKKFNLMLSLVACLAFLNTPTAQAGNGSIYLEDNSFSNVKAEKVDVPVVPTEKLNTLVTDNKLYIRNMKDGVIVDIYNAVGTKVQSSVLTDGFVELKNIAKGMYIVRVEKLAQKIML